MEKLGRALDEVDRKVEGLKRKFEKTTTEATKLKVELEKAQETIAAAENLVGKLEGEYERWNGQVWRPDPALPSVIYQSILCFPLKGQRAVTGAERAATKSSFGCCFHHLHVSCSGRCATPMSPDLDGLTWGQDL